MRIQILIIRVIKYSRPTGAEIGRRGAKTTASKSICVPANLRIINSTLSERTCKQQTKTKAPEKKGKRKFDRAP